MTLREEQKYRVTNVPVKSKILLSLEQACSDANNDRRFFRF